MAHLHVGPGCQRSSSTSDRLSPSRLGSRASRRHARHVADDSRPRYAPTQPRRACSPTLCHPVSRPWAASLFSLGQSPLAAHAACPCAPRGAAPSARAGGALPRRGNKRPQILLSDAHFPFFLPPRANEQSRAPWPPWSR